MNLLTQFSQASFVFCLIVAIQSPVIISAEDEKQEPTNIKLRSVHLLNPLNKAHQIVIQGDLGGKGTITFDQNSCATNQFGDRTICTRAFYLPLEIKMKALKIKDPQGQGRKLYELTGDLPEKHRYFLVVPQKPEHHYRLVVEDAQQKRRTISLEKFPAQKRIRQR